VVIYALAADTEVPRYVFLFVVASIFAPSLVLFELNVGPLIKRLESFKHQNANSRIDVENTERAARSLQRLRVLTLISVSCATAGMFGAAVSSLKTPLDPQPNEYQWSGSLFIIVQACALMIILYFVWVPVGLDCRNGKWLYEVQRRTSNAGSPVNISNPTSPRQGGGGNKPMGVELNKMGPGDLDDEQLAHAHFVAASNASSSRTADKPKTNVSESGGASTEPSSAPQVVEDENYDISDESGAHWRIGSVLGARPGSSSTATASASSNLSDTRAAEPSRGFQQDMEEP